jgi:hypothetical protein
LSKPDPKDVSQGIANEIRDLRSGIEVFGAAIKESNMDAGLKEVSVSIRELRDGIELLNANVKGINSVESSSNDEPLKAVVGLIREALSPRTDLSTDVGLKKDVSEKNKDGLFESIETAVSSFAEMAGATIKDLRDGIDFSTMKIDIGQTVSGLIRDLKVGIEAVGVGDKVQVPQYPDPSYAAILAKLSESSSISPQKLDVAVGGKVVVEFNNNMFKSAVIDLVARELGQTGSLTTAFDNRYPAKGKQ